VPGRYTIFLAAEGAQFLFGLRRAEREPVRRFLDFLSDYPTTEGETEERDAVGRVVQVKLIRHVKVVYYPDHAEKLVKILRIEGLTRR
jgi:hypothetical protein